MQDTLDVLRALADENRLRVLFALRNGELCVCQLIALLELAPSTVSKHLSILRSARLVESRKDGRWMYYRLTKSFRAPSTGRILAPAEHLGADTARLHQICSESMDDLCKRLFCKI